METQIKETDTSTNSKEPSENSDTFNKLISLLDEYKVEYNINEVYQFYIYLFVL